MDAFATFFITLAGAFAANLLAKGLESHVRKNQADEAQRDSDLKDLMAAADDLQNMCEKYWIKSAEELGIDEDILRAKIISQQHNIAEILNSFLSGENKYDCDIQITQLFNFATGDDFGSPERDKHPERLTAILIAVHGLKHKAKAARRRISRSWLS